MRDVLAATERHWQVKLWQQSPNSALVQLCWLKKALCWAVALLLSHSGTQHTESSLCAWHWAELRRSWNFPHSWSSLSSPGSGLLSEKRFSLLLLDIAALASGCSCAGPVHVFASGRGSQLGGSSCWGHSGHGDRPGVPVPDGATLGWQCPQDSALLLALPAAEFSTSREWHKTSLYQLKRGAPMHDPGTAH